ncbi:monofunctional biosynthetic peptidoglycan transglycosylase [Parvularcula marina]|uniref:monofunctional biosynthetic peptidoglycan transglycosylase n=1 Tax=Parvularcula marina TaxID=2292771 RepID=UPI003518394F
MPSKKSKRRKKSRFARWRAKIRLPSFLTLFKWGVMAVLGFVIVSIFWVVSLRFVPAPGTTLMVMRSWSGQEISREWVRLEDISPELVRAVIAAEDTKFCTHRGFDVEQIRKALDDAAEGKRLRGASTISQQTAKNVFLWPGRGFVRKGLEAWYTLLIETFWPKSRIMEMYLNVAEWGDGYFGAEAAAHGRFGRDAAALSSYQASLLAAVLPNPHDWRADNPGPYVRKRAGTLQARMRVVARDGLADCVLVK